MKWILAYGGIGLVLGFALYGYKVTIQRTDFMVSLFFCNFKLLLVFAKLAQVMKTIGYKLTALSPTRGASAELAFSLTVVTALYIGVHVSV